MSVSRERFSVALPLVRPLARPPTTEPPMLPSLGTPSNPPPGPLQRALPRASFIVPRLALLRLCPGASVGGSA